MPCFGYFSETLDKRMFRKVDDTSTSNKTFIGARFDYCNFYKYYLSLLL